MKSTFTAIEEKWAALQNRVAHSNALGFLDLAQYCEDIVGRIFNILYGLSLKNLNRQAVHYPIVDLGDPSRGVYLQVTTASSHQQWKVLRTADRFLSQYSGNRLILFFVFRKPGLQSLGALPKEVSVLDASDLIECIHAAAPAQQEAVLALLRRVEDTSLLHPAVNLLEEDREFNLPISCISCPGQPSFFTYGLGRVRVDAYLPVSYDDTFSCCFSFSKTELASVHPSLSGEEGARLLFTNRHLRLSPKRLFIGFIHEGRDLARIHLGAATIHVDLHTAEQLCELIDALYQAYASHREKILSTMGCTGYSTGQLNKIPVLYLAKDIWRDMFLFANEHSVYDAQSEWHRFIPYNDPVQQRCIQISATGRSLLCKISKEDRPGDEVLVFWEPGYDLHLPDMCGFDNQSKWRLDYTLHWLTEQWLPLLAKQRYAAAGCAQGRLRRLFHKPIPYEEFARFYMRGVTSLKAKPMSM